MLVDEADAPSGEPAGCPARNFGLTISAVDLLWIGNDDNHSQGNYHYQAHAHVLPGGADPLESQGYASAVEKSFQLLDAAREAKSSRAFLFMVKNCKEGRMKKFC
jgi:hypothetical protein